MNINHDKRLDYVQKYRISYLNLKKSVAVICKRFIFGFETKNVLHMFAE